MVKDLISESSFLRFCLNVTYFETIHVDQYIKNEFYKNSAFNSGYSVRKKQQQFRTEFYRFNP